MHINQDLVQVDQEVGPVADPEVALATSRAQPLIERLEQEPEDARAEDHRAMPQK